MEQDDPGDDLPGVVEGTYFSPARLGVEVMKDWIKLIIELLKAITALINSIKRK